MFIDGSTDGGSFYRGERQLSIETCTELFSAL